MYRVLGTAGRHLAVLMLHGGGRRAALYGPPYADLTTVAGNE